MLNLIKTISKPLLLTVYIISLSACGGGNDSSNKNSDVSDKTPSTADKTESGVPDITPPTVVLTIPSSEQTGIKLNAPIVVTFSEAIADINSDNVLLGEFSLNALIPPLPFTYHIKANTLIIYPESNALRAATQYRIFVRGIKDTAGNVMLGRCEWMFGTIGLAEFGIGETGVCSSEPADPVLPKDPGNDTPIIGEDPDVTPPTVVLTTPSSEQTGINPDSSIEVNFNEAIANVISDNIRIYEYAPNGFVAPTPFTFQVKANTLTLYPEVNSLRAATRYQVFVRGIKDTAGNAMPDICEWAFGTIGLAEFGIGKTGVCTTDPVDPTLPNDPVKETPIAGEGTDVTPPTVVVTNPGSEQTAINLDSSIEVNFNESIADMISNEVMLYEYNPVAYVFPTPYTYQIKANTLTIYPEVNSLRAATRYRMLVRRIRDTAGNVMRDRCEWSFGTTGLAEFGVGKTGVCTTAPMDPALPNIPVNIAVFAGDGSVRVSWQAPKTGATVSYYKLEKSADNSQTFEVVNNNINATTLSYTDVSAQNGTRYIYRVIAGNSFGLSSAALSNAIIPKSGKTLAVR